MILHYKAEKLPSNFRVLGAILIPVGIWRIIEHDWLGYLFVVIGAILILFKTGVLIDTEKKRVKIYSGLLGIKLGNWESVEKLKKITVRQINQSQRMSTLTISSTIQNTVFRLNFELPGYDLQILTGKEDEIKEIAIKLSKIFNVEL